MERLTKRVDGIAVLESWAVDKDPVSIIQRLCSALTAYEDTGLEPEDVVGLKNTCDQLNGINDSLFKANQEMGKDLAEWKKANDEDRLVVLPCKVGDVVYGFHQERTILPMVAKWIETDADGWTVAAQYAPMAPKFYLFSDFGKTVFLTREEAEAALKGGEG